jgi:single-strand DNA-binding protein
MSLNKAIILGRLGQDPELRQTPQSSVATFSLATSEVWLKNGQKQEQTEWHRVVVWGKQAEHCAKYLTKGRMALVEGRIQTRSWDDKATGQKRFATEIVASHVQFIGGAPTGRGDNVGQDPLRTSAPMDSSYGAPSGAASSFDFMGGGNMGSASQAYDATHLDEMPF